MLERYCPVVRTASIDEFYLDFTGCERISQQPADASRDATIERGNTAGSISNERTFRADVDDWRRVEAQLLGLSERVCWRARARQVRARTVTLKLRYANFETLARGRTGPATDRAEEVYATVLDQGPRQVAGLKRSAGKGNSLGGRYSDQSSAPKVLA